jgi:hypothetical protein
MIPAAGRRPTRVVQWEQHATVALLRGQVQLAAWPLRCEGGPDLTVVDRLARMQVAAKRLGCAIRLVGPSDELASLLDLVGLGVEVGREPEGAEEVGVEEVVVADDPRWPVT